MVLTRSLLSQLPTTNKFTASSSLFFGNTSGSGDGDIYDLLLHKRDVAYTIPQLHHLLTSSSLLQAGLAEPHARLTMDLKARIGDPELLAVVDKLTKGEQEAVAELVAGALSKQSVYLTKRHVEPVQLHRRVCIMGSLQGMWGAMESRAKGGWRGVVEERMAEVGGVWRALIGGLEEHRQCEGTVEELVVKVARTLGHRQEEILEELRGLVSYVSLTGHLLVSK